MTTQIDQFSLNRKYRIHDKKDNDLFNVKYVLFDDFSSQISNNKSKYQKSKDKQDKFDKQDEYTIKQKRNQRTPSRQMQKQDHHKQQKKKYVQKSLLNRQESLKLNAFFNQQEQVIKLENKQQDNNKINETKQKQVQYIGQIPEFHNQLISYESIKQHEYQQYIDIQKINDSREHNQKIYFKGRVQFNQYFRQTAKIISSEVEDELIVQGKYKNRCFHQDIVYFKIIKHNKDKVNCQIVAIQHRKIFQIVGKIQKKQNQNLLLKPVNKRIIPLNIKIQSFRQEWKTFIDTSYFLCTLSSWQSNQKYPTCRILSKFGQYGEVQTQINAILTTHGIYYKQFQQVEIKRFLQPFSQDYKNGEFSIPNSQLKKRRDFRKWRTLIISDCDYDVAFSIYPFKPKSSDVNFLKKNVYQLNIHFPDLDYFITEKSYLYEAIRQRIQQLNLGYKTLSIIPQEILKIITFQPNKDRLSISLCLRIDENGEVYQINKITRSVTTSSIQLNTNQLEAILQNQSINSQIWKNWNIGLNNQGQFKQLSNDVKLIFKLLQKSRQKRMENKSFLFQLYEKNITIDSGKNIPSKYQIKQKKVVFKLLEQFSKIINQRVGQYLYKKLKKKAIFFKHQKPSSRQFDELSQIMKKIGRPVGINIDNFYKIISEIIQNPQIKQCVKDYIRYETTHDLQKTQYFQVGNTQSKYWKNYATNSLMFTHCLKPTKKYGDFLVFKQIVSTLENIQNNQQNFSKINQQLQKCNIMLDTALKISYDCQKTLLCLFLKDNFLNTTAMITDILEQGIKVCMTKYNIKTIIKFKSIIGININKKGSDNNNRKYLNITYTNQKQGIKTTFILKQLQQIDVQIRAIHINIADYHISIVMPNPNSNNKILIV